MRNALGFVVSSAVLVACHADVAAQGSGAAYGGYPPPQPYYGPGQGYAPPPGQPGYAAAPGPPGYGPPATPGEPATWGIPRGPNWTLREREQWGGLSDVITGDHRGDVMVGSQGSTLEGANRICNTQFAGGFVFDTFHGRFIATENYGVSDLDRYVSAPLRALRELCGKGPMYSDTVRRKVHRVEVRWADGGRSSWVFTGGVLIAYVSPLADKPHRSWDAAQFYEAIETGLPNYL